MSDTSKVVKFKKPFQFNIGIAIFIIIIIYIVFYVISYFSQTTTSWYQVTQGTIASNNVYRGIALREEEIITAPTAGYINYYVKNASRVSVNDIIYSIDTDGSISQEIHSVSADGSLLPEDSRLDISAEIDGFTNAYASSQYTMVSAFKNDLNSEVQQELNSLALSQLDEQIRFAEANNTFCKYPSAQRGLVVYYTDNYEAVTADTVTPDLFSFSNYQKNSLTSNTQVEVGTPIYKMVKSEEWSVIIQITQELAESLQEKSVVKIRFCKDDFTTNTNSKVIERDGNYYLQLSLRTAMVRYINDRFLDIELLLGNNTGLKIPKTAITTKEFYTVPKTYFTLGADSSQPSLLLCDSENSSAELVNVISPTIYYETEDYYYIDDEFVSTGDSILKPDSSERYTIGSETASLIGVYNINKGYAVFKQISIIYENEEYAIIEPKTAYGVALYDHIALDGSKLQENQLIKK